MAAAIQKVALIIKNPSDNWEVLLVKQTPPPKFNDPEYDSYVDSDLWDLPSTQLTPSLDPQLIPSQIPLKPHESFMGNEVDLSQFDLNSALNQALGQAGFGNASMMEWELMKCIEEPDFGPGLPVKTVYVTAQTGPEDGNLQDNCKWVRLQDCSDMTYQVRPGNDRIGPLVVLGLLNDFRQPENWNLPPTLPFQEYPPGIKIMPMVSETTKPFRTTNLVIFVPGIMQNSYNCNGFVAEGDALIVDPGCSSAAHKELEEIIAVLPRKLVVFVTHHHPDHVGGLSVVQKCNPSAFLLAHKNTMQRISKDHWSRSYISVCGSEEICISGQQLRVISAPGHTDGHLALLHVSTNSLIVGDHCVGQGSTLLDVKSGGSMAEYFQTTYDFLELSPHNLIPMHGRVNLWPKQMLCSYLKNRRRRESTILKAIEDGAKTLFDIVSSTYPDVDSSLWVFAASNVRLHVDYLVQQDKLPKEFSLENFYSSSDHSNKT